MQIMNAYCKSEKETDKGKFFYRFSHLHDDDPQEELTLTTSVHCELTLILHSMANPVYPVTIGLSKHCCWLCEKFIEAFQARHKAEKKFFVSGFQGKIHPGWLLPPGTPPAIRTGMEELLADELDEIRAEIEAQRGSDSWPSERVPLESVQYLEAENLLRDSLKARSLLR